jgi:hypothetical protein
MPEVVSELIITIDGFARGTRFPPTTVFGDES